MAGKYHQFLLMKWVLREPVRRYAKHMNEYHGVKQKT
jgi:hypothetical protein